jgi:hypothetical protein
MVVSERRDLVALRSVNRSERRRSVRQKGSARPSAPFLAHLIAVAEQAPQTRERKRVEPVEAVRRYDAANRAAPLPCGRATSRTT